MVTYFEQCLFILPRTEYADVVWDSCTNYEKHKIQTEAARTVIGATKLVSLYALYEEVSWEPLQTRHRKHRLLLLYEMCNKLKNIFPTLILPTVNTLSRYNLRNAQNIQKIVCTEHFNSF